MLHDHEAGSERESLIDATIIATGSGVLSWVFLIAPFMRDAELTLAERAVSAAYPFMGILLVAVMARLRFARRRARLSDVLIGTGLGALLVADTYLGVIEFTVGYAFNPVAELLWLAMYVLLGDLDHFKPFNDSRGHYAGDSLLRDASRAWRGQLRSSDVLTRLGGDEFARRASRLLR